MRCPLFTISFWRCLVRDPVILVVMGRHPHYLLIMSVLFGTLFSDISSHTLISSSVNRLVVLSLLVSWNPSDGHGVLFLILLILCGGGLLLKARVSLLC